MANLIFLTIGLLAGAVAVYFLLNKLNHKTASPVISSQVILDKIERVFKIVTAEGYFSEVFDYSQTTHIASILPSTKKALLIVKAKVMMGYDFKKCVFEVDEQTHQVKIISMPEVEVLSMEPDIKYYNLENGLFNKFDNEDMTKLQAEAKIKITERVHESDLPRIAKQQMKHLLQEISEIYQWQILSSEKKLLTS